ncbi:MAG TPA: CAP domain-containing protein [Pyrinomonadaceae bacterium]|nr:CAP domain-containing protein [Pyrinomonadaceae bacterium]
MSRNRITFDRRLFLKTAGPFALGLPAIARAQTMVERGRFDDTQLPLAREQLLKMVNAERAGLGLSQLLLDDLACQVASAHARDMVTGGFLNHFGSDGLKPHHRYCFAGGIDAVRENASAAENIESVTPLKVLNDLHDMHQSMMDEVPPNDGHRKTIVYPFHTHVGFGVALQNRSLRLDELYLARYLQLEPFVTKAKPKSTVVLKGKHLTSSYFLFGVDVCYEPFPAPLSHEWLQANPHSISLPEPYLHLRPKVPEGTTYTDGGTGDFDWGSDGRFRVRAKLSRDEPGIYTLVFWIRRSPSDKGFVGAQVCILSQAS